MKKVIFVCGEGGHLAQMRRLYVKVGEPKNSLFLVDKPGICSDMSKDEFCTIPLRKKHGTNLFYMMYSFVVNFLLVAKLLISSRCAVLVSTGPGICIIPSIIMRGLGKEVIYIETWSRFSTKSATARIMYRLATVFIVQNEELLALYPRAIYGGRL